MSSLDEIRARRQMMRDKRAKYTAGAGAAGAGAGGVGPAGFASATIAVPPVPASASSSGGVAASALPLKRKQSVDSALSPSHSTVASAAAATAAEKKARVDSKAASPSVVSSRLPAHSAYSHAMVSSLAPAAPTAAGELDVAALLSYESVLDRAERSAHSEIDELLHAPTTKQRAVAAPFAAQQRAFNKMCSRRTRDACRAARMEEQARRDQPNSSPLGDCEDIHFVVVLRPQTQVALGDCSYLDRCQSHGCPYVHYAIDPHDRHKVLLDSNDPTAAAAASAAPAGSHSTVASSSSLPGSGSGVTSLVPASASVASDPIGPARPPEWICCDIRTLDISVLGQFDLIMLDPPWRIRMDLPYATMSDEEMLNMNIAPLQNEGVCCLWVITRALDLGRRCLERWGYRSAGQLLWVKVDQLSRLRRMGRTGHWLNHTKEHCLIGVKGHPRVNRGLDCDVIVAGTRETSRKPDEQYRVFERLVPGGRKLEIFGRQHNVRPNWLTLGNQLDGVHIVTPELRQRVQKRYGPNAAQATWMGDPTPAHLNNTGATAAR